MSKNRLLVVAPDLDLRKSLHFALSAEGYEVTAAEGMAYLEPEIFDTVVVHSGALAGDRGEALGFLGRARSSILLADKPVDWLSGHVRHYVETPLLGPSLMDAIEESLVRTSLAGIPK